MHLGGRGEGVGVFPLGYGDQVQERPDEIERASRDVGSEENGCDAALRGELSCRLGGVLHAPHNHREPPYPRRPQNLVDIGHGLLENVRRGDVDLGHDEDERDLEGEGDADVLLGHSQHAHVGAHHHHGVVGDHARHAVNCRLDVSFVTRQVNKRQHFGASRNDFRPAHVSQRSPLIVDDLARAAETDDLLRDTRCPTILDLMPVAEHVLASETASIVQLAFREHANQGAFSAVDVADHGDLDLGKVSLGDLSYQNLGDATLLAFSLMQDVDIGSEAVRHCSEGGNGRLKLFLRNALWVAIVLDADFIHSFASTLP
mmetsp:Transcript_53479/g.125779  ORF Transcript_53479/g.125779 Transcript_53479/m.125779 type:complete len:316 (-) Transcript_53479:61-1008(-)